MDTDVKTLITFGMGFLIGGTLSYVFCCIFADRFLKVIKSKEDTSRDNPDFWKPAPEDDYWQQEDL